MGFADLLWPADLQPVRKGVRFYKRVLAYHVQGTELLSAEPLPSKKKKSSIIDCVAMWPTLGQEL